MCAKYGISGMNDVCTIGLANFVGLPAKVIWLTAFFFKKNDFCTAFVSATSRLTWESALEVFLIHII